MVGNVWAQQPQYSQYYSAPSFLNPGLIGNQAGNRFSLNVRDQWTAIPGTYLSYAAAYDTYSTDINSGFGLAFHQDKAGSGALGFTFVQAGYSYNIQLNRKLALKPGVTFAYGNSTIDYDKLTFGDQLVTGLNTSQFYNQYADKVNFFDVGAGIVLYGKNFWSGFSAYHLNQPNTSLTYGIEVLEPVFSLHAGYRYVLAKSYKSGIRSSITLTTQFKSQKKWDQFDIGGYYYINPLVVGLWYRGLPFVKDYSPQSSNNDAVVVMVGIKQEIWSFAYSYDVTVSELFANTGGAHEVTMSYIWLNKYKKRKRRRMVPCPTF